VYQPTHSLLHRSRSGSYRLHLGRGVLPSRITVTQMVLVVAVFLLKVIIIVVVVLVVVLVLVLVVVVVVVVVDKVVYVQPSANNNNKTNRTATPLPVHAIDNTARGITRQTINIIILLPLKTLLPSHTPITTMMTTTTPSIQ